MQTVAAPTLQWSRYGLVWSRSQKTHSQQAEGTRWLQHHGLDPAAGGGYRDALRSTKKPVIRCFGLKWVSMMLVAPGPWARRVWALPRFTALCWPAAKNGRQRHKTSIDRLRQMLQQVRRWLPGCRLVVVVEGGFAAVSLALTCVKHQVERCQINFPICLTPTRHSILAA